MASFNFDVEYGVQMKCNSCKEKIEKELSSNQYITIVDINVPEQRLILRLNENSPSAFQIQNLIEQKLGLNTIIRGTGNFVTAVAEIRGSQRFPAVIGVARFIQNDAKQCLIDAVIEGLGENQDHYELAAHEFGDLSEPNFESLGEPIFPFAQNLHSKSSSLNVKNKVENCDLNSFIGHALSIRSNHDILGAGIIARASKIMDNSKKICACSGKTLWQERLDNKP